MTVRVDYQLPADQPLSFANNLLVQRDQNTVYMSFFVVRPPMTVPDLSLEEMKDRLSNIESVPGRCVAQVAVPIERMPEFLGAIARVLPIKSSEESED